MEKLQNEKTQELFQSVERLWNKTHTFSYRIDGDRNNIYPIEIYNDIALADIQNIVKEISICAYLEDGVYEPVFLDGMLAKYFLEYFTDCPLPLQTSDTGESVADLNMCYELVFGRNGITHNDRLSASIVDKIRGYLTDMIDFKKMSNTPGALLSQKGLELYYLTRAQLEDLAENPATILSVLEGVNIGDK